MVLKIINFTFLKKRKNNLVRMSAVFVAIVSEFIVRKLELWSCQIRAQDQGWIFQSLLSVGVPLPRLLSTYNK